MCLFVSDFSNMKINGSNFCCLLVQLFLMVKSQMSWLTAEEFSKPNFIILVNHDHAVSTLGLRNSTFQKLNPTTNITALAEDGWFFSNAFCSNGSSAPSTATLLTGKFAHQHGLLSNGQKFDPNQPTLLKALTSKGYETALFGRWDLLIEPAEFDHWEVLDNANVFFNPTFISVLGKRQIEGHTTDITSDLLIQWIKKRGASKKPFVAFVFFNATQRPWMPTLRQLETYNDILLPEPETLFSNQKEMAPASRYQRNEIAKDLNLTNDLFMGLPEKPNKQTSGFTEVYRENLSNMNEEQFSTWQLMWRAENEAYLRDIPVEDELIRWKYQRFAKNYLRCVRDVDENIGRIRSFYEEFSTGKCFFAYTAHQGRFVGENGWFGSQWMMDQSMRIPLIITTINGEETVSKTIQYNVQDIDFAPTILSMANCESLEASHGIALNSEDWNSTSLRERKALYFHHYDFPGPSMIAKHNGIRTDTHKLINYYQFGEWELFDVLSNPLDSKNIIDAYDEIEDLKKMLLNLQSETSDSGEKTMMPEKWRRIYRGPSARME